MQKFKHQYGIGFAHGISEKVAQLVIHRRQQQEKAAGGQELMVVEEQQLNAYIEEEVGPLEVEDQDLSGYEDPEAMGRGLHAGRSAPIEKGLEGDDDE